MEERGELAESEEQFAGVGVGGGGWLESERMVKWGRVMRG